MVTHRVEDILNAYADKKTLIQNIYKSIRERKLEKKNNRQKNSTGTLLKRISKWPMSICKCSKLLAITKIKMNNTMRCYHIPRRISKIINVIHIKN